jgi:phenylalanyl-tRNA synthetase beta subunit
LLTNIPSAAYDADKVGAIEVNYAKEGEILKGLNGNTYELTPSDIVVRSNGRIICLAGIHGDAE